MRLLLDFLCRGGWGLAAGLVLTPAALVPAGFFRVNLLVVLGACTLAAPLAWREPPAGGWLVIVVAAVVAWLGSVAWLAERGRPGRWACAACALLLGGMTAWLALGEPAASAAAVSVALVSGLVVGLTLHAMLLGHWYLNAPGMRVDVLRRMIDVALAAWGVQCLLAVGALVIGPGPALPPGAAGRALVALRWLGGLAGLPVLLVLARRTLEIPNTQSATGILYVACLAAILGELTARLLQAG